MLGAGAKHDMRVSSAVVENSRDLFAWTRAAVATALLPSHRRMRYLVLIGLGVRFVLAPLTSWGYDTVFFTISATNLVYIGNPYAAYTFYNPPLGPFLQLPLVRLAGFFQPLSSFVQYYPSLVGLSQQTEMAIPYLPTPAALLLIKTPLILSDLAVGVLLYAVATHLSFKRPTLLAAGWLLNPLVIWSTAVHGEVDTLAALLTLAFVLALWRRWSFAAGVCLTLGAFAKVYPVAFLPLAIAWLAFPVDGGPIGLRGRLRGILSFLAGGAAATIPFLTVVPDLTQILVHQSGNTAYGGLNILILFNPALSPTGSLLNGTSAGWIVEAFYASLAVAAFGSALLVYWWRRQGPADERGSLTVLSVGILWCASASLLAAITPQSENVVAVVPALLLLAPLLRRGLVWVMATASAIAWLLYLFLLSPLAYFYPLAEWLGPQYVHRVNLMVVAYTSGRWPVTQGIAWTILGAAGGLLFIGLWGFCAFSLVQLARRPRAAGPPTGPGPTSRGGRPRLLSSRVGYLGAVTVVVLLCAQSLTVLAASQTPPLTESLISVAGLGTNTHATIGLRAGGNPVEVHVGLVPGTLLTGRTTYVFADRAYPDAYASYTQISEVGARLRTGSPVHEVDASGLISLVDSNVSATILVLGGIVPDALLSNTSGLLVEWVRNGGHLVWAGGPLGFDEGHLAPDGSFIADPMGWAGQTALAGYPVTDPGPIGPLNASMNTPLSTAFGFSYDGTPYGANVSELRLHSGLPLGLMSGPTASGSAPRVSLAYLPVGQGGIFFFGGSFRVPPTTHEFIGTADFGLSSDLEILLGAAVLPMSEASTSVDLRLSTYEYREVSLNLPTVLARSGAIAIVTVPALPVPLVVWETIVVPPTLS